MRRETLLLLVVVIGAPLIVLGIGFFMLRLWLPSLEPQEVTDVSEYTEILQQWKPSGLVDWFPTHIPAHATNVRVSHHPGFLQGGARFHVRMTLPTAEIAKIETE